MFKYQTNLQKNVGLESSSFKNKGEFTQI